MRTKLYRSFSGRVDQRVSMSELHFVYVPCTTREIMYREIFSPIRLFSPDLKYPTHRILFAVTSIVLLRFSYIISPVIIVIN